MAGGGKLGCRPAHRRGSGSPRPMARWPPRTRRRRAGSYKRAESYMSSTIVQPVAPAAGYIGGKRNLAGRLTRIIDQIDHQLYAEPFVGMGGIFLRRRRKPRAEVINAVSGDIVTFFRV